MRSILLLLLLAQQLIAQTDFSDYHWQQFHLLPQVEAVTETEKAIWWSTTDYLVCYDKESTDIEIGINPFTNGETLTYAKFWSDEDGTLHLLNRDQMAILVDGEWEVEEINTFNGVFTASEILYRTTDNTYLLRGENAHFMQWQPGSNPSTVPNLGALAPWFVHEATWDREQERIWITAIPDIAEVGFIEGDSFTEVSVPPGLDRIYELHTAPDGGIWLLASNYILRYNDQDWIAQPLTGNWNQWELQLSFSTEGNALITTPLEKLILQPTDQTFETTDLTVDLQSVSFDSPCLLMNTDEVWFIDDQQKAVSTWKANAGITRKGSSAWLPINGDLRSMSQDTEGRIWITDGVDTYFFSGRQWWPARTIYPNFPDSVRQLVFTQDCSPIVLTASDPFGFTGDTRVRWYRGGNWVVLPPPIPSANFRNLVSGIFLDDNDNLWTTNSFSGGLSVWSGGAWQTLDVTNFFPTPAFVRAVAVDEDNRQYIAADNALFIRSGQDYQRYPYEQFDASTTNNNLYRSIRFSPEGNLWIGHDKEVLKVSTDGRGEKIPFFSATLDPLPNNSIFNIFPFSDNEVWILYANDATACYDGLEWTRFNTNNSGLLSNMIRSIEKDQQGRYWFSSQTGISVLIPPNTTTTINRAPVKAATMRAVPNPACCQIQISWQQEERARVRLALFDSQGRQLRSLLDQILLPGEMDIMIDRRNLPAGTYFIQRITDDQRDSYPIIWK